jgi:uncharacterized small protein (TIGR04563 family)
MSTSVDPVLRGGVAGTDKVEQALYFPEDMLAEITDEATRQDVSLSWVVQKAWKLAREEIRHLPAKDQGDEATDTSRFR